MFKESVASTQSITTTVTLAEKWDFKTLAKSNLRKIISIYISNVDVNLVIQCRCFTIKPVLRNVGFSPLRGF